MEGVEGDPQQWGSFNNLVLQKSKDELVEEEEKDDKTILQVLLRPPHFSSVLKIDFPELCRKFSAVTWCSKTNLICCAVETCSRDQGSTQEPVFWIPMHLVDPERPTEHSIFNIPADCRFPGDSIQHLQWSPNACPRTLLIVNAGGRASIWSQLNHGGANVAHTSNGWSCEYEWRQEQSICTKWLESPPRYRWTSSPTTAKGSFEEKYLPHQPRASARWPNFLCICSVFWDGTVQLHWKQWPGSSTKWFATKKGVLGAGASGVFTGDAIISDSGSLLVAAAPVGNPSTIVVWEVTSWDINSSGNTQQVSAKIAMNNIQPPLLPASSPSWPGFSPLAAYLFSWQDQLRPETLFGQHESSGPLLHCSVVSNFSAYVSPDAAATSSWGSGVTSVAFDPSRGGSALVTTVLEGYYISPGNPDAGPALTGWRILRWECGSKPVNIHPLLENSTGPPPTMITWTSVAEQNITRGRFSDSCLVQQKPPDYERPVNPRSVARLVFAAHGGELAVALFSGEVHVFSGPAMTPVEYFHVKVNPHIPTPAFSPTSCCLASVWHDNALDVCTLRIAQISPVSSNGPSLLERHLADRFWWSLVSEVDWWDVVATTQAASKDGHVTVAKVMSVLDTDFHALHLQQRHHYGPALDRIKCQALEGVEAADIRVLVLDMQGRLMLDLLGRGIEAALMNPSTLIAEPWQASSETLTGLGVDAMAVDTALVQTIQAYVDGVLDLASHFLTRLRRYASFCRTLTAHAASGTSSATTSARSAITSSVTPLSAAGLGGVPAGTVSSGGPAQVQAGVQAWVQGAIAKISSSSSNTDSPASVLTSTIIAGPAANLPLSVSTATFPGTPAVRLISDCYFLHRLCQLLLFCLIFRKRQFPRHVQTFAGRPTVIVDGSNKAGNIIEEPLMSQRTLDNASVKVEEGVHSFTRTASTVSKSADDAANPRVQRVGSGNCGQGYTSDEVKYLFLVLVDLCKRTGPLPHLLPKSQLQSANPPSLRLHFIDGQFTVAPEVVEASLGPHMQNLPRPRGADAAGLLMRELELHPPVEDLNRRMLVDHRLGSAFLETKKNEEEEIKLVDPSPIELWPRKRRRVEHDAGFGVRTALGLGRFTTLLGSRRDVITSQWKPPSHGVWHKCLRCGRQTSALSVARKRTGQTPPPSLLIKVIWYGRWAHGCPMCGGRWSCVV